MRTSLRGSVHDPESRVHPQLGVFRQRAPEVVDAGSQAYDAVPALPGRQFRHGDLSLGAEPAQAQVVWVHAAIDRLEADGPGLDGTAGERQPVLELDHLKA